MSNINELVFEALQNNTGSDTSSGTGPNKSSSTGSSQSSSSTAKGFGAPSVNATKPSLSITRPKVDPTQRPGMITKPNVTTSPDFMKKNKPKFGLGSGKSLMGW